jgi:xanthine dehydrogenase small subunit
MGFPVIAKPKPSTTRSEGFCYLNGKAVTIGAEEAFMTVAEWLRKSKRLPGTKIVCAEGDCGACSIMVASIFDSKEVRSSTPFKTMNACIMLVAQLDGCSIVSVEALSFEQALSPLQKAMVERNASQCGYCTPGFTVTLSNFLARHKTKTVTEKKCQNAITGNLCRCTGYSSILEAAVGVTKKEREMIDLHLQSFWSPTIVKSLKTATKSDLVLKSRARFIPGLPALPTTTSKDAVPEYEISYFASSHLSVSASHLHDLIKSKRKSADGNSYRSYRIVAGGTDLGVLKNKNRYAPQHFISLIRIPELHKIIVSNRTKSVHVGAQVSLEQLRTSIQETNPEFARLLNVFASPQIKERATLAGNIANASPIGDTMPYLMATNAIIELTKVNSKKKLIRRKVPIREFYKGYKVMTMADDEIISRITFPFETPTMHVKAYKVSQRKDLDISTVSLVFSQSDGAIHCGLGGVAATPVHAVLNDKARDGTSQGFHEKWLDVINQKVTPMTDLRGSKRYREILLKNLIRRYMNACGSASQG